VNYFIRKFINENIKEENEDTYNLLLTFCIKKFDSEKRISEYIIDDLSRIFNEYFEKDISMPFDKIKQSIVDFKNSDETHLKLENRFGCEYIRYIQISNFKGFQSSIKGDLGTRINFHNKKNIFYGANGSGKTSFCEALEYKLTGSIKEAKRRGIREKEYFERKDKGVERIEIGLKDEQLILDKLTEFEISEFNKCFIEKNRINEFALLRGHKETAVKPTDVTARLLGFEVFDDFKSKFVQPTSFKSRVEKSKVYDSYYKLKDLKIKNESREEDYKSITLEIKNFHQNTLKEEALDLSIWCLNAAKEKLKRYELIEYKKDDVKKWLWHLLLNGKRLNRINSLISTQATKLDFKSLYTTIISIGDKINRNTCPACKTPIEFVTVNPFENAEKELNELKELNYIQLSKDKLIDKLLNDFWTKLNDFIYNYKTLKRINLGLQNEMFESIEKRIASSTTFADKLSVLLSLNEYADDELKKYLERYSIEFTKSKRIDNLNLKINDIIKDKQSQLDIYTDNRTRFRHSKEIQKNLFEDIYAFKKSSKILNKKILQEKAFAKFIDELIVNYNSLISNIDSYLLKEQSELITQIKGRILGYYKEINKGDSENEIIQEIEFNQQNDKTYSIDLKRNDGWKKASVILSEGHVRSLGLSIILSIAESANLPFIVFDDVVNAIDSEHRANIIDMMFANKFLKKTQLIVTTHDRLFWERFCNTYSSRVNKRELSSISFCFKYQNQGIIYVPYQISFEEKIKEALSYSDIRQALVYLRIWFETICFNYCKTTEKTITGHFSQDNSEKPTHLVVSLTKVYNEIITPSFSSSISLKVVQEKLNWKFLNQEHHSFDENIFNVTHSTTSSEIEDIFEAVKNFEQEVYESIE